MHGSAGKPKQLARNAKNPGKTRVFERRGQEPNFSIFSQPFRRVRKVLENGLTKGLVSLAEHYSEANLTVVGLTETIYDTEEGLRNAEAQAGY